MVLATSKPGDLILDPFSGSGTTAAVANRLGRDYLGLEREADYLVHAHDRLEKTQRLSDAALLALDEKREAPRVPFGSLVERGFLEARTQLVSIDGRHRAKVRADVRLVTRDFTGSIHQTGAHVLKAAACNGWTFGATRSRASACRSTSCGSAFEPRWASAPKAPLSGRSAPLWTSSSPHSRRLAAD